MTDVTVLASRLALRAGFIALLLQAPSALAGEGVLSDKVSFYFAAHQDDWQLFMNPSAFQDVASKAKSVFVHLTAGDAGLGTGSGGRKYPYYLARENGAETAIRFMADDAGDGPIDARAGAKAFNGHPIYRTSYRGTATYFLRLPDGHPTGSGFKDTGNQSLARLAGGQITSLAAIDGSTVYRGWVDIVSTLRSIIDYERLRAPLIQLNVAEQDPRINPDDHSDHQMTAKAALEAAKDLGCARRVHYVDYASKSLPENLGARERDMESSVLAVTAAGILARDHASIWNPYFRSYLGRNYFRAEEASGPCGDGSSAQAAGNNGPKGK
jgi:hypothetical protein